MALFAIVAAVASSAVSAFGQHKAGQAAKAAARENAITAEQNAQFVEAEKPIVAQNAAIDRRRLADQYTAAVGDFIVNKSGAGLDPTFGSAAALQADAKRAYNIDRQILANNEVYALRDKDIQAYNYRRQASNLRAEGAAAAKAGNLNAIATLLQGASTVSKMIPSGSGA